MITKINTAIFLTRNIINNNQSNSKVSAPDHSETKENIGAKILSTQISFGINKNNIKNYTKDEVEFLQFRQNFSNKLHKRTIGVGRTGWDFYINSTDDNLKKYEKAQNEYAKLFQDEKTLESLQELSKKDIKNLVLLNQLNDLIEAFENECKSKEELKELRMIENKIAKKFNSYEPEIKGKKTTLAEVQKILDTSKDEVLRKQAYTALVKHGDEIADDMVEFVKKRNEYAQSKGYKNYFEYKLKKSYKVDAGKVSELFDELALAVDDITITSRKEKDKKLKKIFNTEHLEQWHYSLPLNSSPYKKADKYIKNRKILLNTAKEIYKDMGWDIEKLPITLDLFPKKNKNSHGFCFGIDTNKDVRILANLKNDTDSIETLCHELGHSVYNLGISEYLTYIDKSPASSAMTEAVAEMMQDVYIKEDVLKDKLNIPESLSEELKDYSTKTKADFVQKSAIYFNFEKSLYEDPDQDLAKLWYSLKKKHLKTNPPKEMHNEWCNVPHFLSHPAYYQNYLRADIMAAQIYDAATKKLGPLTKNPQTASYLQKLFKTGAKYSEDETLKRFTGSELNVEAYKKKFEN